MQQRTVHEHEDGRRTWVVVLDPGDELMATLQGVVGDQQIEAASFTAIGACERAELAYFDWQTKQYRKHEISEQVELASLVGDVARTTDGKPKIHMHGVVALPSSEARAGHVMKAWCRPTIEVVIDEVPTHLRRVHDEQTGLALIDLAKV